MLLASTYFVCVVVRIAWVFVPQTGYIHPDEFFQFSERVAADVFGFETTSVWEFDPGWPLRSVFFPFLVCGLPFALLRELGHWVTASLSGYWLLVSPRLVMTLLSFAVDNCVLSVSRLLRVDALPALVLFATSYTAVVFFTRTLTNAIEAVLFALLISLVVSDICRTSSRAERREGLALPPRKTLSEPDMPTCHPGADELLISSTTLPDGPGREHLETEIANGSVSEPNEGCGIAAENEGTEGALGKEEKSALARSSMADTKKLQGLQGVQSNHFLIVTIVVSGVFNRPTFLAFAAAPCCFWLFRGRLPVRASDVARALITALCCFPFACNIAIMLVLWDSYYYRSFDSARLLSGSLVVTPLNFLAYNSDPANLAQHGLHPRYLHALVNVPLLLGPATPLVAAAVFSQQSTSVGRMLVASFAVPLAALSFFRHQEPRFLLPLVVPAVLLVAGALRDLRRRSQALCCLFAATWLVFNSLAAALFGVAHQGGVVPVLLRLGQRDAGIASCHRRTDIIFYHTYMPPLHLLGRSADIEECELVMHDLKGADKSVLEREVLSLGEAILVTPFSESDIDLGRAYNISLVMRVFPHITFDDIPSFHKVLSVLPNGRLNRSATINNIKRVFSLNVYRVVDLVRNYEMHPDKQTLSVIIDTGAMQS